MRLSPGSQERLGVFWACHPHCHFALRFAIIRIGAQSMFNALCTGQSSCVCDEKRSHIITLQLLFQLWAIWGFDDRSQCFHHNKYPAHLPNRTEHKTALMLSLEMTGMCDGICNKQRQRWGGGQFVGPAVGLLVEQLAYFLGNTLAYGLSTSPNTSWDPYPCSISTHISRSLYTNCQREIWTDGADEPGQRTTDKQESVFLSQVCLQ